MRGVGELFEGLGYTAVSQRVARTKEKNRENGLRFNFDTLKRKCGK